MPSAYLREQLHVTPEFALISSLHPVRNDQIKPRGGLWTSTYIDGSSGWVDWCRSENFGNPDEQNWFLLHPDPAARVYVIDSLADLQLLANRYPPSERRDFSSANFERVGQDYDAVHLTEEGQWATRLTTPNLYGWDCESTLWFRWKFTSVERIAHPSRNDEYGPAPTLQPNDPY